MPVEIGSVSYRIWSEANDLPFTLKYNTPDVHNKIKGTDCGGYHNIKCATCGRLDPACAGHWHKLMMPGIALYIKSFDHVLLKLSETVCFVHRGLAFEPPPEDTPNYRKAVTKLLSACKEHGCQICGTKLQKLICAKKDDTLRFLNYIDTRDVNPIILYEVVKTIPLSIQKIITGQNIPLQKMFYVDCIPIVPTYLRVSSKFDRVNEYAHYLTNRYLEIISRLKEHARTDLTAHTKSLIEIRIQTCLNEIIDGKETIDPKQESCSGYLKTKYNLFREYINGKRNPKTARVVLNVNELSGLNHFYPCTQYLANITTAIYYNKFTAHIIDELINNQDVIAYYSCTRHKLVQSTAIQAMQYGDYVEVSMTHGDRLVINGRQPALHLTNIYTGKAIVAKRPDYNAQSTQLPTAVLPGMNGDQDGDEVWSKEVQGLKTKYEQLMLMLPVNNMISPAHGGINYGIIQDELLSINRLLGMKLSYNHTIQLLGPYARYLAQKQNIECDTFTGRDIISAVVPSVFNKTYVVKNGICEHTRFQSGDLGVGSGTVFSITKSLLDYDRYLAKEFLESILHISKNFITLFPSSLRASDMSGDLELWREINNHKEEMYRTIEANRKKYFDDCKNKLVIPMDSDYSIKFIKLEVAKVVNEINSKATGIVTRYINDFNSGRDFNRLVLYILAGYKLDLATLSIIFSQANPSIEPRLCYLNRLFSTFVPNEVSLANLGLVSSSLIEGLNLRQMALLAARARENVVTTVCQTASKGEMGRYIIKNLENYCISFGTKYLTLGKIIMSHCLNVYKMPVRQMFLVNLDIDLIRECLDMTANNSSDQLSSKILKYYQEQAPYLYDPKTNKYTTQVAYLTDIQLWLQSYRHEEVLSSDEVTTQVENFFNRVHEEYMYGFSTVSMLKLITLMMCKKYNATRDGLRKVLDIIEQKYKLYPEVGAPIGTEAGTSISEVETQSTLSAHLQFTKNGCDVKSTQTNTNISLMKINVSKSSAKKIFKMMSRNIHALKTIKNSLEFVSLEDIALEINYSIKSEYVIVNMKISRTALENLSLPEFYVDHMLNEFCDRVVFIQEAHIKLHYEDHYIRVAMALLMDASYLPVLKLMLKQGVSKGIFSLYRYTIDHNELLNPSTMRMEPMYVMTCEIPSLQQLAMFDTTDIIITPSIEISAKTGPMQSYNLLSHSYIGNGLMKCHTSLLAQHQTRHGIIQRVEKNPKHEMTTISKIAFIKPIKDLQIAAQAELTEPMNDLSSCILMSAPIQQGTGIIDVSQRLDAYINQTPCSIWELSV